MQEYVDLYGGKPFYIEVSYSNIMKIIFITAMFGTGIPILYPICALNMFVLFITEKYYFAYYYKRPPMFNNMISDNTLKWLKWTFFV